MAIKMDVKNCWQQQFFIDLAFALSLNHRMFIAEEPDPMTVLPNSMNAVQVNHFGGPEQLTWVEDMNLPIPLADQVLVQNHFSGLNYKDILCREGAYHAGNPSLPFVPGIEAAGMVVAVGSDVSQFVVGDRVAYMTGTINSAQNDCYAQYTVFNANSNIVKVPEDIGLDQACALMVQGLTAHYLTTDAYAVKAGDTILVHGAAGGLGQLLVQLCKRAGATVIGTCSQHKKSAAEKAGCDFIVAYNEVDFAEQVLALTEQRGVDAVYDGIGKTTFLKGLDCIRTRGTMVLFGNACGEHPDPIAPTLLTQKGSLHLIRPALYDYLLSQQEMQQRAQALFTYVEQGDVHIDDVVVLPLASAPQAHRQLMNRELSGKILFSPV